MITGPDVVAVSGCPESRRRVGRGGAYMTTTSTWWVPGGGELPPFEAPSLTSNVAALSSPSSSPPPPPQGDSPIKYRAPKGEKEKPTGVRRNLPPLATQSGRALPLLPFPSSSSHGDGETCQRRGLHSRTQICQAAVTQKTSADDKHRATTGFLPRITRGEESACAVNRNCRCTSCGRNAMRGGSAK